MKQQRSNIANPSLIVKVTLLIISITLLSSFSKFSFAVVDYPEPSGIENMLFYVQRTVNTNTIIYELNLDSDSNLVESQPIKAYWIKYEDGNKKEGLSLIQRKYAYGIEAKVVNKEKQLFSFHFVSYKKREFYLLRSGKQKKFKVYAYTDNKLAELEKIHVQIEGGTFMLPNIKYVLVKSKNIETGELIIEKIKP